MRPKRAGEWLGKLLKQHGLEAGFKRGSVLALWPQIAGEALASLSEPVQLTDGVLWVKVPDAVVAHQLTYNRQVFLERLQAKMPGLVKDIRFQVGVTTPAIKVKKPTPLPELSGHEQQELQQLAAKLPSELQGAAFRAGLRLRQRQKANPHPPCPICGTPSSSPFCPHCTRLLQDPLVQREANRLRRKPLQSRLGGELLGAARHLATEHLQAEMTELLPEVVRNPELLPLLQDVAKRYLQLRSGQSEVSTLLALLPNQVRHLLKSL